MRNHNLSKIVWALKDMMIHSYSFQGNFHFKISPKLKPFAETVDPVKTADLESIQKNNKEPSWPKSWKLFVCFILVTPIRFIDCEALGLGRLWGGTFHTCKKWEIFRWEFLFQLTLLKLIGRSWTPSCRQ